MGKKKYYFLCGYFPWNAPEFPWDIYHGSSHLTPCFPRRLLYGAFHGIPNDHMRIPTGIQVDRAGVCHLAYPTEFHTRSMRYRINTTTGLDPSGPCGSSHRGPCGIAYISHGHSHIAMGRSMARSVSSHGVSHRTSYLGTHLGLPVGPMGNLTECLVLCSMEIYVGVPMGHVCYPVGTHPHGIP